MTIHVILYGETKKTIQEEYKLFRVLVKNASIRCFHDLMVERDI